MKAKNFIGLVKVDELGNFGVPGLQMIELNEQMYSCVCKLKDYEKCKLHPDELEILLNNILYDNDNDIYIEHVKALLKHRGYEYWIKKAAE